MFDAGPHILEGERVLLVRAAGVPHGDADLADPIDSLDDQRIVPVAKGLVSAEQEGGRLLQVEYQS